MSKNALKERPKYLNLMRIKLPVTGVVSFFHRVSGILLILSIPLVLFLLDKSIQDEAGFNGAIKALQATSVKLIFGAVLLAVVHHLSTGIRFLLFDLDLGVTRESARKISWLVLGIDVLALLLVIRWII